LGRQNLAFRGHRDQGKLNTNIDLLPTNEGNFRQLLKFKIASGDKILEKHLQTTSAKATYISHTTQEQLIECCKEEILSHILNNVKESCYYSVIFDETTDISHISQLSLSLRYVDKANNVHEQFIGFINCHDYVYDKLTEDNVEPKLTGIVLGNAVVSIMKDMSLDLNNCVGIGTDGCSVMTSVTRGAVAEIQKTCPNAVYSPCSSHALNLSISKSSNVQLVRNTMGIIKEVLSFFNTSSKRSFVLKNCLKGLKRSITGLCETRWVERHECIFEFQMCLSEIIDSLTYISEWIDQTSSSKAKTLLHAISTCEFVLTLYTMSNILSVTAAASRVLQGVAQDIATADNCIKTVVNNLENKRSHFENEFKIIFEKCKTTMTTLDIEVKVPRISKHQSNRSNTPASCPEEYYRRILYIPILDNVLEDIHSRFYNNKNKTMYIIMQLLPIHVVKMSTEKINELIITINEQYQFLDINEISFNGELDLWKTKWISKNNDGK